MSDEYKATVVKLPELIPLAGCDNVAAARIFGYQIIVSKDSVPGTLGVFFSAETQLSEEYLSVNNLFRQTDKNRNPEAKGYFENNGRVKAVKFRGHRSDGFWMPLSSLLYVEGPWHLHEGESFTELKGHQICQKYVPKGAKARTQQAKVNVRVSDKFFPKHFDTSNFFRNSHLIPEDARVIVTQKLHGTSVRIGHVPVPRKLRWYERVLRKLGVQVQETEYEYVAGSRNVVKGEANDHTEFYGTDIYSMAARTVLAKGGIPKGYVLYGELIGWTPEGMPIQKAYTYDLETGDMDLYVYRVAVINQDGNMVDLGWDQVKEFCRSHGLAHVPELATLWNNAFIEDGVRAFLDMKLMDYYFDAVLLATTSACDEGVCLRVEGLTPLILKAKSPLFLQHETKLLDAEEVDLETVG